MATYPIFFLCLGIVLICVGLVFLIDYIWWNWRRPVNVITSHIYGFSGVVAEFILKFKYKNLFLVLLFIFCSGVWILNFYGFFYFKIPYLPVAIITFFAEVCRKVGVFSNSPNTAGYSPFKPGYLLSSAGFFKQVEEKHGYWFTFFFKESFTWLWGMSIAYYGGPLASSIMCYTAGDLLGILTGVGSLAVFSATAYDTMFNYVNAHNPREGSHFKKYREDWYYYKGPTYERPFWHNTEEANSNLIGPKSSRDLWLQRLVLFAGVCAGLYLSTFK